jgi:hypothetical protein
MWQEFGFYTEWPVASRAAAGKGIHMTMVKEAKNVLKNGTTNVMSTVRRGRKAMERSLPMNGHRPVTKASRIIERQRTYRVPVGPIVLAVGIAALAATGAVLVRRLVTARYANDEEEFVAEDSPASLSEEELVTSR